MGYNSDMSAFAPNAHLTAPIWNWGPYYVETVEKVRKGTWKSEAVWPGLEHGIVDIAAFGPMVHKDLQKRVLAIKEEIKSGKFKVFTGPIKDQKGKLRIAKETTAPDKELLGMTWFVQGVIGTTE